MDNGYLPPTRMESHREKLQIEQQCEALRLMLCDLRQLNRKERRTKIFFVITTFAFAILSGALVVYIIKNIGLLNGL